jgi:hypothetical protein
VQLGATIGVGTVVLVVTAAQVVAVAGIGAVLTWLGLRDVWRLPAWALPVSARLSPSRRGLPQVAGRGADVGA